MKVTDRRLPGLLFAAAVLASVGAVSACAQDGPRQGQAASAAAVDSVIPRAQRSRSKGAESAPVTIVEVSDFQCPYCRQFAEGVYHQLDSAYLSTGKARLMFINYPLANHTRAYAASEAAMCAGAQGQFWPMHDRLFAAQREWSTANNTAALLEGYATELRLDMAAFRDCTANDRTASVIMGDVIEAAAGGVNGTPAFFLAGPGGRRAIAGAPEWAQLRTAIEEALAPAPAGTPAPQNPPPAPTPQN